ncbi:MAG: hypothetical protein COZ43_09585 [Sphingomonadales bacterium CG_4_10_14_3_um_filter_58_15]|nr:MAG: hypothetical protein COZ43_09585 [Sphingomonadales bacterium CG_4_10_14_3_um_filter_58_15]
MTRSAAGQAAIVLGAHQRRRLFVGALRCATAFAGMMGRTKTARSAGFALAIAGGVGLRRIVARWCIGQSRKGRVRETEGEHCRQ